MSADQHVEVWSDRSGTRVDTRKVVSYPQDDCLGHASLVAGSRHVERAPLPGLTKYFVERFRRELPLPADAVDTGWTRGTRHVWLSRSRRQAPVGAGAARVESWPELTTPTGCG